MKNNRDPPGTHSRHFFLFRRPFLCWGMRPKWSWIFKFPPVFLVWVVAPGALRNVLRSSVDLPCTEVQLNKGLPLWRYLPFYPSFKQTIHCRISSFTWWGGVWRLLMAKLVEGESERLSALSASRSSFLLDKTAAEWGLERPFQSCYGQIMYEAYRYWDIVTGISEWIAAWFEE